MKFTVTFKDPDALHDQIERAVMGSVYDIDDADEREAVAEVRREKVRAICGAWFEYGEYLRVEIDTDAKTCVVLPVK